MLFFDVTRFSPPLPRSIDAKRASTKRRLERQCFGGEGRGEGAALADGFPLTLSLSPKNSDYVHSPTLTVNFRILEGEGTGNRNFKSCVSGSWFTPRHVSPKSNSPKGAVLAFLDRATPFGVQLRTILASRGCTTFAALTTLHPGLVCGRPCGTGTLFDDGL